MARWVPWHPSVGSQWRLLQKHIGKTGACLLQKVPSWPSCLFSPEFATCPPVPEPVWGSADGWMAQMSNWVKDPETSPREGRGCGEDP